MITYGSDVDDIKPLYLKRQRKAAVTRCGAIRELLATGPTVEKGAAVNAGRRNPGNKYPSFTLFCPLDTL